MFSAIKSATMAGLKKASPAQSNRIRGARSRERGSNSQPSTRPTTPTGALTKKIERQPAAPISRPPTLGPNARPTACAAPWIPIARPRLARGIAVAINATELAWSMAAPIACTMRHPTRTPRVGDSPQPTDATVNTREAVRVEQLPSDHVGKAADRGHARHQHQQVAQRHPLDRGQTRVKVLLECRQSKRDDRGVELAKERTNAHGDNDQPRSPRPVADSYRPTRFDQQAAPSARCDAVWHHFKLHRLPNISEDGILS